MVTGYSPGVVYGKFMDMIEYRKATVDDAAVLAKYRRMFLSEANQIDSHTNRIESHTNRIDSESALAEMEAANLLYFSAALADGSFVAWLAVDGGEIVATSGLTFSTMPPSFKVPNGKTAYIMNMYTLPSHRRQGVGTELFRRIVGEAVGAGCAKITLSATDMGRPLYEKYGFRDSHGSMVYYVE